MHISGTEPSSVILSQISTGSLRELCRQTLSVSFYFFFISIFTTRWVHRFIRHFEVDYGVFMPRPTFEVALENATYPDVTTKYSSLFSGRCARCGWLLRLGYCFTPCQRLWLYNGVPLVAFYDTLGIRRTYSRLKPPASSRGRMITSIEHRYMVLNTF